MITDQEHREIYDQAVGWYLRGVLTGADVGKLIRQEECGCTPAPRILFYPDKAVPAAAKSFRADGGWPSCPRCFSTYFAVSSQR